MVKLLGLFQQTVLSSHTEEMWKRTELVKMLGEKSSLNKRLQILEFWALSSDAQFSNVSLKGTDFWVLSL